MIISAKGIRCMAMILFGSAQEIESGAENIKGKIGIGAGIENGKTTGPVHHGRFQGNAGPGKYALGPDMKSAFNTVFRIGDHRNTGGLGSILGQVSKTAVNTAECSKQVSEDIPVSR